jgi:Tol biopolymer transport system component
LWSVEVANGSPAGLPELVKKDVPPLLAGTRDGSYYYVARSETYEMYLVDVDPKTGARVSRPKSVAGVGYGTNAVWSPDGGSLAYRSAQTEAHAIVIRSAETGTERLLLLKGLPDAWGFNYIAWFSDGRSLLLQGRGRVYRADLQTGESRQVLASARMRPWGNGSHGRLRLTPDGVAAYFTDVDDARHTSILRQNLEGGPATEVCKVEDTIMGPSLSPDGSTLAFATVTGYGTDREHWAVMTVPAGGGEPKEIFGSRTAMVDPVWSRDGRWLYFAADANPEHQGLRQDIWRVPVSGGKPEPLDMGLHRMANLDFSRDGRHLVFRDYQNKNELWVMKNLFPAPKPGK